MKTAWKLVLSIGGSLLLIIINVLIVIIGDIRLRHIWWSIGLVCLVWLIVAIVTVIIRYSKKPEVREKLDIKTAKEKVIQALKYDTENPDNFQISDEIKRNKGEGGSDKTPIVWFPGKGTENNERIDVLVNLNDSKGEPVILRNRDESFIEQMMEEFAENPSQKIIEERIRSTDPFGRPMETIKTSKAGESKKKTEEEEKKSAF